MDLSPRTDLALETRQRWSGLNDGAMPDGVCEEERDIHGVHITAVTVLNEQGAKILCKPIGKYITLEADKLVRRESGGFEDCAAALGDELRELIKPYGDGSCLVVGLGNPAITPDSVGHITLRYTMVTRHLREHKPEFFSAFRSVAALEPGVLGTTGMESAHIISAVVSSLRPDFVIVVDALASASTDRLCRTVQITDTGITPGSGVGNARAEINRATLGVPVIAVGVPTVTDAAAIAAEAAQSAGVELHREDMSPGCAGMIVTPRDIDARVSDVSRLLGYGIDLALHPDISIEDVDMFVG